MSIGGKVAYIWISPNPVKAGSTLGGGGSSGTVVDNDTSKGKVAYI